MIRTLNAIAPALRGGAASTRTAPALRGGAALCWLGAVLSLATACGGSEEATPGGYSDVCKRTEDCEEGLECANGICTGICGTSADCAKFSNNSVCVNRCFEFCTDSVPCKRLHPSLQCVQFNANMGTCKVQ